MLFTRTMICASLLFGASSGLQAQETALESQEENRVQPEAKKLLERMAAFYKKMEMATVEATLKIEAEGLPQAMRQEAMTAIKRPNKFVSLSKSPMMGGFDASSDGEKMIIAMAMANAYSEISSPKNFNQLLSMEGAEQQNSMMLVSQDPSLMVALSLFSDSLIDSLLKQVDSLEYVGEEKFNGVETIRLLSKTAMGNDEFSSPNQVFASNADIWILKGESPWLVGLRPDLTAFMTEEEAQMGAPMGNMTMTIEYAKWAEAAPENGYEVPIKETWRQVDDLMQTIMEMSAQQMGGPEMDDEMDTPVLQAEATHPTVGMQAPDFTLKGLRDGKEVTLASLKGKVVVLDFWATWCAPCVAGLPTVDKVTSEFKSKGVVFYAVDLQEGAEKVQTFVDKKGWKFPVLMDPKGEIARAYRVSGIPHSVIIGADGKIRNVHIGFGGAKALEAQLREELTEALKASGS
mgnify:CR=1 FL=1